MNLERFMELMSEGGFFYPSFEIYRSKAEVGGFYDYGPLGVELKRNIIEKWRKIFVYPYQDFIVEIETPIVMPKIVFEASGHVEHFTDAIVECTKCGRKFRADHLIEEELGKRGISIKTEGLSLEELDKLIRDYDIKCPVCGGELSSVKPFNLLFQTTIGPYSDNIGYIRPETAQGMFVSFPKIFNLMGRKLPLGIAQIGKVGRNEISPRQGLIRLREFTQMEIEFFFDPENAKCPYLDELDVKLRIIPEKDVVTGVKEPREFRPREAVEGGIVPNEWMAFFMGLATIYMNELGISLDHQYFLAKLPEERAHYSAASFDQMVYSERFGWVEVSGHAYRTDYDLGRHARYSGYDLSVDRRLTTPKEVVEVRVYPNPQRIREVFGNEMPKVMQAIGKADPRWLANELANKGRVIIDGYTITSDVVFIREERRKVHVERFIPHDVEPSFGVDRIVYVTLEHAYTEVNGKPLLRLPPDIAPIKVAVLPIIKKQEYVSIGRNIFRELSMVGVKAVYDDDGAIGSRYAKYDSVGVPFAITIDDKTPIDSTVTIRDRDTKAQIRVSMNDIIKVITDAIFRRISIIEIAKSMGLQLIIRE
ncbi:glycyl-tRNA synthetase [Vulcanisaeta moutnovskia 768-28]|uniref:glycine--tRNA ligase n=1 Tax=Vulcanisaeta moutnovskia (strain 768-28) TaxID=985053 RepID=F0QTU1_VULM7|nr:glycine--tRNA ligase [Vulcanisaeta moutnovskia]ADY00557.1 glycyl-tRNA synthetase [Vulcanisaeta moutnovskia 768-28]